MRPLRMFLGMSRDACNSGITANHAELFWCLFYGIENNKMHVSIFHLPCVDDRYRWLFELLFSRF